LNKRNRSNERKNSRLNGHSSLPKGKFRTSLLNRIFYEVEARPHEARGKRYRLDQKIKIGKVYKIPIGLPLKESKSVARDCTKHSELGMGFLSLPESPFDRATRTWVSLLGGASSTSIFTD